MSTAENESVGELQDRRFRVLCFPVKEECLSGDEDVKDTLVEQILQQGDTAIIYPEAPEDDQSPAETGGADENGSVQAPTSSFLSSLHPFFHHPWLASFSPLSPCRRHAWLLLPAAHLPVLLAGLQAQRLAEGAHQVPARDQRGQLQLLTLQLHLHLPLTAGEAHEPPQGRQGSGTVLEGFFLPGLMHMFGSQRAWSLWNTNQNLALMVDCSLHIYCI